VANTLAYSLRRKLLNSTRPSATLAYYDTKLILVEKIFILQSPSVNVIKLLKVVSYEFP
jgi:hypothetical protein